jgi:hypothetical protein
MQKAATLIWRIAACMPTKNLALCCRFPPLVLSRSGSYNIEYLFEYGERSGIRYQRSAEHIENANFFLVHALSSFRNSLDPLSLPGIREQ